MPSTPRLHWPVYSPEATLPKTEFPVCPDREYSESYIQSAIFRLDRVLRRWQHIYEFCQADDCLLRVAITSATKTIALPDGNEVSPGDQIMEIHWWNEHVARLISDRPALARAKILLSLVQHSFEHLAKYVATAPEAKKARFIHGNAVLPMHGRQDDLAALAQQYGFWVARPTVGYFEQVHDLLEEYLVRALLWAFHRRKHRGRRAALRRVDLWTTRAHFLAHYRPPHAHAISIRHQHGRALLIVRPASNRTSHD
ncbi:MAG: YkoP family protein [Candidatus Acidiferrales bacterium]